VADDKFHAEFEKYGKVPPHTLMTEFIKENSPFCPTPLHPETSSPYTDTQTHPKPKEAPNLTSQARNVQVTSSKVMRKEDGSSRGFGFVNFEAADEAKAAVESINMSKVRPQPFTLHLNTLHPEL